MPKFNRSMRLLCASSLFAAATCSIHAQAAANPAPSPAVNAANPAPPDLEPKAVDILKAACAKLAAAKSMSFTAIVTYESPSRFGLPLAYGTKSEVLMQRPNKLRVITRYDGPPQEFYYDGKNMTAYAPNENFVAVAAAPSSLDDMLSTAFHTAAIYFPFDDVIVTDPYKDLAKDLRVAFYIGQSQIVGGITTDIVAYDTGGVFIQAWIGHDDHLPRILRAIYVDDPAQIAPHPRLRRLEAEPASSSRLLHHRQSGHRKAHPLRRSQHAPRNSKANPGRHHTRSQPVTSHEVRRAP